MGLGFQGPQWGKKLAGSLGRTPNPGRSCGEVTTEWPGGLWGAAQALKGQLSFHPVLLLTRMTTAWGLGRLGRTLPAAIQTSLSKSKHNLSHLTRKVDSRSLSELTFSPSLSSVFLMLDGCILRWVSRYWQRCPSTSPRPISCQLSSPRGAFLGGSNNLRADTIGLTREMCASLKQSLHLTTAWSGKATWRTGTEIPNLGHPQHWAHFLPSKPRPLP